VDQVDLYQIHGWNPTYPIEESMEAMRRLQEEGKTRSIGVSNFLPEQMERALKVCPFSSNQVRYSLLDRSIETNGVLDAARDLGMTIIAYSPLAQGILSGRFHDEPGLAGRLPGFRKYMPGFRRGGLEKSRPVIEALRRIAPTYGATPVQVALNWVITKAGRTVVAIPGASRAGQVDDFLAAMSFRLSGADREELDRISAPFLGK